MWAGLNGLTQEYLVDSAERDAEFRESIRRAGVMSLRAVGALEFAVPLLMLAAGLSVVPVPPEQSHAWVPNVLFGVLGAITAGLAYTPVGARWPRLLTSLSIAVSVAIIVCSALLLAEQIAYVEHHVLGYITLVMFGAAAALPLKAVQTLALGIALDVFYLAVLLGAGPWLGWKGSGLRLSQHAFVFLVTLLCAALTASVYRQRYRGYLAHQQALRTAEELREAQNRLLIADNAAVMGRVAAALSHELNSPVGVLASAVDTLTTVARRMGTADPAQQQRLHSVLDEVSRSGKQSAKRLHDIVTRIQRFTNLDRADVQSADLNSLLADVIGLIGSEQGHAARIVTELGDIPHFQCRPQQISAVFSNVLSNALESLDANGKVLVTTRAADARIEVAFTDNGRGIPEEDIPALFDPAAFRVSQGRVKAGNWSLFSCRQIVQEHGGDIEVASAGTGTTVKIVLPA